MMQVHEHVTESTTGVCIIRVEAQPDGLIIAVSTRRDIDRSVHTAFEDRPRYFTKPEDALAVIEQFLEAFQTRP
ncbi:MAG: hypothetical protein ABI563_06650 [Specibacter sp.]